MIVAIVYHRDSEKMVLWKEVLFLGYFFIQSGDAQTCDDIDCTDDCLANDSQFGACKCFNSPDGPTCTTCPDGMSFFGDTMTCVNSERVCQNQMDIDNCQLDCQQGMAGDCKCIDVSNNGNSQIDQMLCVKCPPGHVFFCR